jgi:hypothetical protein
MKTKILITLGLASFLFAACKKTYNGPVLTPQETLLTSKIWKLKSLSVASRNDPSTDSSITKSCSDSALMAFDIYGDYQLADPTRECDSTIVPYDRGNWMLSSGNDSLLLQGQRTFIWKIEVLNDTLLKASFHDSISPTNNWVKKITLN